MTDPRFDKLEKAISDVTANTSDVVIEQIKKEVAELSKDKKNYFKIALLTHSDKVSSNNVFEEILKVANDAYAEVHRAKVEVKQATPEDIKRVKILEKKDKLEIETQMMQNCSIPTIVLAHNLGQAQQELLHSFISNTVETIFTLISDRLIMTRYPKNTVVQNNIATLHNNVDILNSNQNFLNTELEMCKQYKTDLQRRATHYDKTIQRKLKRHLEKENK